MKLISNTLEPVYEQWTDPGEPEVLGGPRRPFWYLADITGELSFDITDEDPVSLEQEDTIEDAAHDTVITSNFEGFISCLWKVTMKNNIAIAKPVDVESEHLDFNPRWARKLVGQKSVGDYHYFPPDWYCDNCAKHLDAADFDKNGRDYTCTGCGFKYSQESDLNTQQQVDKFKTERARKTSAETFEGVTKEMIEEGMKVELEHTDDEDVARQIAIVHITEDRDYYKKLKKVEAQSLVPMDWPYFTLNDKGQLVDEQSQINWPDITFASAEQAEQWLEKNNERGNVRSSSKKTASQKPNDWREAAKLVKVAVVGTPPPGIEMPTEEMTDRQAMIDTIEGIVGTLHELASLDTSSLALLCVHVVGHEQFATDNHKEVARRVRKYML